MQLKLKMNTKDWEEQRRVALIQGLYSNQDPDFERDSKIIRKGTPVQDVIVKDLPSPVVQGNEKNISLFGGIDRVETEDDQCDT